MVQQAINAKAKADLRSSIMIQDLDIHYPKGHWPFNATSITKVQT